MTDNEFAKIKRAVVNNTGGFENAEPQQIRQYWKMLPKETQKQYLKTVSDKQLEFDKKAEETNANL